MPNEWDLNFQVGGIAMSLCISSVGYYSAGVLLLCIGMYCRQSGVGDQTVMWTWVAEGLNIFMDHFL